MRRTDHPAVATLLQQPSLDADLKRIGEKVLAQQRLTPEEGLILFEKEKLALWAHWPTR